MKVKLGNKTYEVAKFSGMVVRNMLMVQKQMEEAEDTGEFGVEQIDLLTETIVTSFKNQFTTEELLNELDLGEIIEVFKNIAEEIGKKTQSKFDKLLKN